MVKNKGVNKWKREFDCHHCGKVKYVKDSIRDGMYCIPMVDGKETIYSEDFTQYCKEYVREKTPLEEYCNSLSDYASSQQELDLGDEQDK